jgi:hypothetical protein
MKHQTTMVRIRLSFFCASIAAFLLRLSSIFDPEFIDAALAEKFNARLMKMLLIKKLPVRPPLTNPYLLRPAYIRTHNTRTAEKLYRPALRMNNGSFLAHRYFWNADQAKAYAARLIARWRRLYDSTVAGLSQQVPA